MRILFANYKGGTGKSTVVFNMALWRQARGKKVVVCDLDPQHTLMDVVAIRAEDGVDPPLDVITNLPTRAAKDTEYFIDVGAAAMDAMRKAIGVADRIVIPVTPSQADIWATQQFMDIVQDTLGGKDLPQIHGFINRADPYPMSRENAESLLALKMLPGITPVQQKLVQRVAFRRSFSEGLSVAELEPRGKAADELDKLGRALLRA